MAGLKCRECGVETNRLYAVGDKYGCRDCVGDIPNQSDANLHMRSKYGLTYADKKRILTRTEGKDGVWRAAPKWRSDGY